MYGKCCDIVFFTVYKMFFSFCLTEALDSKGILNTLKKVLRQLWNALTWQLSLSLCDKFKFKFIFRQKRWSYIYLQFYEYLLSV